MYGEVAPETRSQPTEQCKLAFMLRNDRFVHLIEKDRGRSLPAVATIDDRLVTVPPFLAQITY